MNVVLDTNVVVSAIYWPGEARECLVLWAKRRYHLAITIPVFDEYHEIAHRLAQTFPAVNPSPWLKWIEGKAKVYEPAPLGKQRSSDPDDDPILACALGSGAKFIVSHDNDLLELEKPFGVEILPPRAFLRRVRLGS